jgi:hypothetical protein
VADRLQRDEVGGDMRTQISTMKSAILAGLILSTVAVAACTGPTSPTAKLGAIGSDVTLNGVVNRLDRSGTGGIDVSFRVGDEPFIRGDANTTVLDGSITGDTTSLRTGYTVTVQGRIESGTVVYARHVIITAK